MASGATVVGHVRGDIERPLTDYARFGLWCSRFTCEVARTSAIWTAKRRRPPGLPHHDYWLFASSRLVTMHFDETDRFTGAQIVDDPAVVMRHCHWRDAAWNHARRRDEFATPWVTSRDQRPLSG